MSLNSIIRKIIKEETEEWVELTPEEYIDLLPIVNYDGSQIKRIYKGKKIKINGNLNLNGNDNILNIDSIDYVDGDLDISYSTVPFFDKNNVSGNFRYYGSKMEHIEEEKRIKKLLENQDELRKEGAWEGNDEISNETDAIYLHLKENNETYSDEDKYYLVKDNYTHYGGNMYTWFGKSLTKSEWVVYRDDKIQEAAEKQLEGLIDELGHEAFSGWVWKDNLDTDYIRRWLYDSNSEAVNDDPESYGIERELSRQQQQYVDIWNKKIESLNNRLETENLSDQEESEIEKEIENIESLIEDINENPQGDYDEDEIEDAIQRLNDDDMYDFPRYLKDRGFDNDYILNFVDVAGVIEDVIRLDGYGHILNGYDGTDNEYKVDGTWHHVMRYN
jgi:hypothetical protein